MVLLELLVVYELLLLLSGPLNSAAPAVFAQPSTAVPR